MRRVRTLAVSALLAGLLVLALAGPVGAQTGERIQAFDVDVVVAADGTLEVTERITYDFGSNQRRGIFRVIPVRYDLPAAVAFDLPEDGTTPADYVRVLDLDDWRVSSDTAPDDTKLETPWIHAGGGAEASMRIGDEDTTITGVHTYTISYTVQGAMNGFGGAPPELNWNATGSGWRVPMDEVTVRVSGPGIEGAQCFRGAFGVTDTCEVLSVGDGAARIRAAGLGPGEGVTVVTRFAADAVEVPDPILRRRWTFPRAFAGSGWSIPVAVLLGLVAVGGVLSLAFRQGRDRVAVGDATVDGHVRSTAPSRRRGLFEPRPVPVRFRPPEDLRPGLLGLIVDERVDPVDVSATIVDLAQRGHLRIEEESSKVLWIRREDWRLVRTPERIAADDPPLREYERLLLDGVFDDRDEVLVSDLTGDFATDYRKVERALYEEGRLRRWFNGRPDKIRTRWSGLGVFTSLASLAAGVVAALFTTFAVVAVPFVIAGLVMSASASRMPHRTPKGSALLTETLGFKEFILTAETDRMDFAEAEQMFVAYLPYAVVFGAVDRWAERFAAIGVATTAAVGGWYVGSGAFDAHRFSAGLSDFSSAVGSSMSTVPSSGGSGGGFSGGGMGGGGGGSW